MKHNICTGGCGGVSSAPGTCEALACPKYGQPLVECECSDEKHEQVLANAAPAVAPENVQMPETPAGE